MLLDLSLDQQARKRTTGSALSLVLAVLLFVVGSLVLLLGLYSYLETASRLVGHRPVRGTGVAMRIVLALAMCVLLALNVVVLVA